MSADRLIPLTPAWDREKAATQVDLWRSSIGEEAARERARALLLRFRALLEGLSGLVISIILQLLNAWIAVAIEGVLWWGGFILLMIFSARHMKRAQELTAVRIGMIRGRRWLPMSEPEALARWIDKYADRYR